MIRARVLQTVSLPAVHLYRTVDTFATLPAGKKPGWQPVGEQEWLKPCQTVSCGFLTGHDPGLSTCAFDPG